MPTDVPVVNELQLAEPLAKTLAEHPAADFAWVLATLSEDVMERAELVGAAELPAAATEQQLRQQLAVEPPVKLFSGSSDHDRALEQTSLLNEQHWDEVRWLSATRSLPLVAKTAEQIYPSEVLDLLPPAKRVKVAPDAPPTPRLGDLGPAARTEILLSELKQLAAAAA